MPVPPALAVTSDAGDARIRAELTPRELRSMQSSFSQRIPRATPAAKNDLRALLTRSGDAALVADLQAYFNNLRENGHPIYAADVAAAIRLLGGDQHDA